MRALYAAIRGVSSHICRTSVGSSFTKGGGGEGDGGGGEADLQSSVTIPILDTVE